jgi:hypothetical protein
MRVIQSHASRACLSGSAFLHAYRCVALNDATTLLAGCRSNYKRCHHIDAVALKDAATLQASTRDVWAHCHSNHELCHHTDDTTLQASARDVWAHTDLGVVGVSWSVPTLTAHDSAFVVFAVKK